MNECIGQTEQEGQQRRYSQRDEYLWASNLDLVGLADEMDYFGTVETIDGCIVEPDGVCPHGYRSPLRILGII